MKLTFGISIPLPLEFNGTTPTGDDARRIGRFLIKEVLASRGFIERDATAFPCGLDMEVRSYKGGFWVVAVFDWDSALKPLEKVSPEGFMTCHVQHEIYKGYREFPDHYVVRKCYISAQMYHDCVATIHETLDGARAALPDHLVCMGRFPDDAPEIVEIWI